MKKENILRYGLLLYALFMFFYEIFSVFLPFAKQSWCVKKQLEPIMSNQYILYKIETGYTNSCFSENVMTSTMVSVACQAVFTNDPFTRGVSPYLMTVLFWLGQLTMLSVALLNFILSPNVDKDKPLESMIGLEHQSLLETNKSNLTTRTTKVPCEKCCRPLFKYLIMGFKMVFVTTTFTVPAYYLATFEYSNPCLRIYSGKLFILNDTVMLSSEAFFVFLLIFVFVESICRFYTRGQKDYFDCFCAISKRWWLLPCYLVIVLFMLVVYIGFGGTITATLWFHALTSNFPKATTLGILNIFECILNMFAHLLCCRP